MAIQWGAWQYAGGNGMRVGVDVSVSNVNHGSSSVTFTFRVYTQNQYSYNDNQTLSYSGSAGSGSTSYHNSSGGGSAVLRATRSHTHNYGSNSYGSSPGDRVFRADLSGAYNGITPFCRVVVEIPPRPYADPLNPTNLSLVRNSDSSGSASWKNNDTAGRPYDEIRAWLWNNVTNSWGNYWVVGGDPESAGMSFSANRRYRFRIRARNSVGASDIVYSNYVQTTPAAPTQCAASDTSSTSARVTWQNNASTTNGYDYSTRIQQSENGGAWVTIATVGSGTTGRNVTNLNPGSTYQYRVAAVSTVGSSTVSSYSTSAVIQLMAPPPPPSTLTLSGETATQITLDWTNNPHPDGPYESITVQRRTEAGGTWVTVASLPGTAASFTYSNLQGNHRYDWRIRANNAASSSSWVTSSFVYTTPATPAEVVAQHVQGGSIRIRWVSHVGYSNYTDRVEYRSTSNQTWEPVSPIAAGVNQFVLESVALEDSYEFRVRAASPPTSKFSEWAYSPLIDGATPPNTPIANMPSGQPADADRAITFRWTHTPSLDGSEQLRSQLRWRVLGDPEWIEDTERVSTEQFHELESSTLANGEEYEWQVRTWGVHDDPSPWSSTAVFTTSATPIATINSPEPILHISQLIVDWTYFDAESTTQIEWEVVLYDGNDSILEERRGANDLTSVTMNTSIEDGASYRLTLRVRDGSGLWSDLQSLNLTADFIPPAESLLDVEIDPDSGASVLTLTPTEPMGGVTLPATTVDIQRLFPSGEEGEDEWHVIAKDLTPDATIIDPSGPVANDGLYRAVTYSAAPSLRVGPTKKPLADERWLFLSGGQNFERVCRMWANIELKYTAGRDIERHHFAGRRWPVAFAGQARHSQFDVAGLLDAESSPPIEWERLVYNSDVLLLRDPLGRRMYGTVEEVSTQRLDNGLYSIAFSIRRVKYP